METPKLRTIDDETIQQVKERIVEACNPEAIILFGSAARGETRYGSDIDLLVIMDLPEGISRYEQAAEIYGLFRGWRLPLDIIIRTPEHYDEEKQLLGMISNIVDREGIRIYG